MTYDLHMNEMENLAVADFDIHAYQRDGAVCLRKPAGSSKIFAIGRRMNATGDSALEYSIA
jgi:hypothetical protein